MTAPPLRPDAFPVTTRWRYLNTASMGAIPQRAVDEMTRAAGDAALDASLSFDAQMARLDEVRATAAAVLGVPPDDVTFVPNTTTGTAIVATGLRLAPGDRVVVPAQEFPSTVLPWLALRERGVIVDTVEPVGVTVPAEAFADVIAAGAPPRVVVTSWVHYATGWRTDLAAVAALAHEAGALLVVDAIQGVGVVPAELAAWGVDAAAADGHKWMLGPNGAGLLYLSPAMRAQLVNTQPGWLSAEGDSAYTLAPTWLPDARRFTGGTPPIPGIFGLGAGLDLLVEAGIAAVWGYVSGLGDRLVAGLLDAGADVISDRSPDGRSAIVTFAVPGVDAAVVTRALAEQRVVVSPRGRGVRVAPHGFNTVDDLDVLVATVRSLPR